MTGTQAWQPLAGDTQFYAYTADVQWTPETIRRARDARGWTQQRLADELSNHVKTSLRAVTAWELDESKPSGKRLIALNKVFGDIAEDFDPDGMLANLTDAEVQQLLARIPDLAIVSDIARRFARTAEPRPIGDRVWRLDDAPAQEPPGSAADEQRAWPR